MSAGAGPEQSLPIAQPRFRRRIPCSLRVDGREHRALVLNLSRGGLFVRTTARAHPGACIELDLPLGTTRQGVPLRADVVWRRVATSALSQVNDGGLGLRLTSTPAAYEAFMSELDGLRPPEAEAQQPRLLQRFDVRIKQLVGPRSRWLQVDGQDEAAARRTALSSAGEDWEILEVRRAG